MSLFPLRFSLLLAVLFVKLLKMAPRLVLVALGEGRTVFDLAASLEVRVAGSGCSLRYLPCL